MKKFFLGLDQGTTGTTAILFDENWRLAARGYREIRQIYPQAGWVEHDAMEIGDSVLAAVRDALSQAGAEPGDIACIGIDHEGESVVMWDKLTGTPIYNTIVWQDRSFEPRMSADQRERLLEDWRRAVERCLKWSRESRGKTNGLGSSGKRKNGPAGLWPADPFFTSVLLNVYFGNPSSKCTGRPLSKQAAL